MADPYTLKRKPRAERDFPFFCPFNETGFPVRLRRLTNMELVGALEKGAEYESKYITGFGERGTDSYQEPRPLPAVDGEAIRITSGTCRMLAILEMAQAQDERYSFEELAAMSTSDAIAEEMMGAADWVQPEGRAEGNPQGSFGTESSTTASEGSTDTQS